MAVSSVTGHTGQPPDVNFRPLPELPDTPDTLPKGVSGCPLGVW